MNWKTKLVGFNVGDKVKIVKPCNCNEWNGCKSIYFNAIGEIISVMEEGEYKGQYMVKVTEYNRCYFSKDKLEKV